MRVLRAFITGAVVLGSLAVAASPAAAMGGDIDLSWGDKGYDGNHGYTARWQSTLDTRQLYVDADGTTWVSTNSYVVEYDAAGEYVGLHTPATGIVMQTVATRDAQGRFLIGGKDINGNMRVERFTAEGADATFGTDGGLVLPSTIGWQANPLLAAAADGSLALWTYPGKITRITSDGALDTTWNPDGTIPGVADAPDAVAQLVFQGTGALLVNCRNWASAVPCLIRYGTDGAVDTSFGSAGTGNVDGFPEQTTDTLFYNSVLVGDDDSFYAAGGDVTVGQPVLAHYTADGLADTSWGTEGLVRDPMIDYSASPALAMLRAYPDGGFLAVLNNTTPMKMVRYTDLGERDLSFGAGGLAVVPDPEGYQTGLAGLEVAPDGGILTMRRSTSNAIVAKTKTTGLTAVSGLVATPTANGVHLAWTNPTHPSFHDAQVRVIGGLTAPTSATGTVVTAGASTADVALAGGQDYSFSVFARDYAGSYSDPTSVTVRGSRLSALVGGTVTYPTAKVISSKLTSTTAAALAGKPVAVWTKRHGLTTWVKLATVTTASTGIASYTLKPTYNTDVQLRFAGSGEQLRVESNVVTVNVASSIPTTWSKTSLAYGTSTKVSGTVGPNQRGQYVYLQRYYSSAWRTVSKVALSSTSTYAFTVKPPAKGYLKYRVYKPADVYRISSTSRTTTLHVT